jgi:hypothetical protein
MKKIVAQIKSFAGLITAVVVIAGATKFVDRMTARNQKEAQAKGFEQVLDSLQVMNQNIEYLSIENSNQDEQLQNIHDTLLKIDKENKKQSSSINTLIWAQQNEESFTPEQLREIMNEMLKKNDGWSMKPIALPGVSSILSEENTRPIRGQ